MKSEVEVMMLRTISNPLICEAIVPMDEGRCSMRMVSARWKNHSESSPSIFLQTRSMVRLRTCLRMNSKVMAITTPVVSTHSVWNP